MEKFYTKFTKEYIQAEKERLKKKPKKSAKKNSQNNVIFEEKNGKKSQNVDTKSQNNVNFGKKSAGKSQNNVIKIQNKFSIVEALFKENKLDKKAQELLENFDRVVQGVRPLNSKQLQKLPENIKALSHQLTDQRCDRRLGYMNESVQLSSYVRYYTWWNLVRLTKLFSNLPAASFPNKECICLDIGSGPLTLVISLWLSRPELRNINLTWYCLDVSSNSMALGEDVYLSIVAQTGGTPWKIVRVKGSFGTGTFIKEKADFITCANMFNELDQASDMPPEFQSKKYYFNNFYSDYNFEDYRYGKATHGHLPDKGPQPIFCAKGPAFCDDVVMERANLVDEAPTYAKVLGVELRDADGKVLEELLR